MIPGARPFSRRRLLLGGAGVLAGVGLAACGDNSPAAPRETDARSGCPGPLPKTVDQLLASQLFVVAHRGSGDNWPEHTLLAYGEALKAGAAAVEISVRATKDGVLVCYHDASTERTSRKPGTVAELTFAELADYPVDARELLGPATALQPVSKLSAVLAALPEDCLVLIEDKDGSNAVALLDLLDLQPRAQERFVWKQWAGAKQVVLATERGYRSWGYFTDAIVDRLDELAPNFTSLGIGTQQPDEVIAEVVAIGKPTIAWEVHRRSERDRLAGLGVQGMMCSNVVHVLACSPPLAETDFASGRRAAGDLPTPAVAGWASQPFIDPGAGVLRIDPAKTISYLLGSLGPIMAEEYSITFAFRWPELTDGLEVGLGVLRDSDADYRPYASAKTEQSPGLRLRAVPGGRIELAEQTSGSAINGRLAALNGAAAQAGAPTEIELAISASRVTLRAGGQEQTINNLTARGGYVYAWARGGVAEIERIGIAAR